MRTLKYFSALFILISISSFYSQNNNNSLNSESSLFGKILDDRDNNFILFDDVMRLLTESTQLIDSIQIEDGSSHLVATMEYNSAGELLSQTFFQNVDGQYINKRKYIYEIDKNGNSISEIRQLWEDSIWVNSDKFSMDFDDLNRLILYQLSSWEMGDWQGMLQDKYIYTDSLLTKKELYQWRDMWRLSQITNYTYNEQNKLQKAETKNSQGVPVSYQLYTYNTNLNLASVISKKYNYDQFIDDYIETYTYNSNNQVILKSIDVWFFFEWTKRRYNYFYDSGNNKTEELILQFFENEWVKARDLKYYFDNENKIVSAASKSWYNDQWNPGGENIIINDLAGREFFFSGDSITVYYKTVTDITNEIIQEPKDYVLSQNYPNPFNPATTIRYSIPVAALSAVPAGRQEVEAQHVTLKIYNILGNEVATLVNEYQQAGNYEVKFNAADLASGIYFYRLTSGKFSIIKKMILLK